MLTVIRNSQQTQNALRGRYVILHCMRMVHTKPEGRFEDVVDLDLRAHPRP